MSLARRDVAGLMIALAAAAVCVALGFWQVRRLGERRERNAVIRAARERPVLEVVATLPADSAHQRRLHAHGVYDYAHERVWRARSFDGVPGVALITPLRLADGAAVLVDRGWAASPDAFHVDQSLYRESDTADVGGIGLRAPRSRGDVDPATLRDSVPYRLLGFVLQQFPPSPAVDRSRPPGLVRWPVPELSNGPHLAYAIQWFSFAVVIVVGCLALARKQRAEG